MDILPRRISWQAVCDLSRCRVEHLTGSFGWGIIFFGFDGQDCLIDFEDKRIPTYFEDEVLARKVLENLETILVYLRYRGLPRGNNLTSAVQEIFSPCPEFVGEKLSQPEDYYTLHWEDVPQVDGWAPIDAEEFADHTWGIVANMPDDEYLVLFEPGDPDLKTFHPNRESALKTIDVLLGNGLDEAEIDHRLEQIPPPLEQHSSMKMLGPGKFYFSQDPIIARDVQTVLGIRDDWYNRRNGEGKHCFCRTCVSQAQQALGRIESHYAGPLDWELHQALKEARNWIPVR